MRAELMMACRLVSLTASLILFGVFASLVSADPAVQVKVTVSQSGSGVSYVYRVINNSSSAVVGLRIGFDYVQDVSELRVPPLGWTFEQGLSVNSVSSPAGWQALVVTTEESPFFHLQWSSESPPNSDVGPNTSRDGFRVTTAGAVAAYETGHFDVILGDSTHVSGILAPDDISVRRLTALSPARVWIGLKNSDDIGTTFDLLAEVYKGGVLIGSGQLNSVRGGSSGFNNAKLYSISLALAAPVDFGPGSVLSIKLSARITCSGKTHSSGTVRLWFNDVQADSRFGVTIGNADRIYWLLNGFGLATSIQPGLRKTLDLSLNSKVSCPSRSFLALGTWSVTVP